MVVIQGSFIIVTPSVLIVTPFCYSSYGIVIAAWPMHSNCCLAGFQKLESGMQDFYPRFLWPRILIFCYLSYDAKLARIGKKQSVITNPYCYLQVVWLGEKSHAQEEAGWAVDQQARFSWDSLFCCGFVCQLTNELIGSSPLSRASSSTNYILFSPSSVFISLLPGLSLLILARLCRHRPHKQTNTSFSWRPRCDVNS